MLSTRPKIMVFISVNFQWPMKVPFAEFPEKSTTSQGVPNFRNFFYRECRSTGLPYQNCWLNCSLFGNSAIFGFYGNFSRKFPFLEIFWIFLWMEISLGWNPLNARVASLKDLGILSKNNLEMNNLGKKACMRDSLSYINFCTLILSSFYQCRRLDY